MKTDFREMVENLRTAVNVSNHVDSMQAEALLGAFGTLSGDELDVVGLVVDRLALGRKVYGQLEVATDGRDWAKEARDEALDLLIYEAIGTLKRSSTAGREGSGVRSIAPTRPGGGEAVAPTSARGCDEQADSSFAVATLRGSETDSRRAHNPEIAGSTPAPATTTCGAEGCAGHSRSAPGNPARPPAGMQGLGLCSGETDRTAGQVGRESTEAPTSRANLDELFGTAGEGNPFRGPWRNGGTNVGVPMSRRLVNAHHDAVAYVRDEVEDLVRAAPALLAAAELAVDSLNDVHYANPVADERIELARQSLLAVIGLVYPEGKPGARKRR